MISIFNKKICYVTSAATKVSHHQCFLIYKATQYYGSSACAYNKSDGKSKCTFACNDVFSCISKGQTTSESHAVETTTQATQWI